MTPFDDVSGEMDRDNDLDDTTAEHLLRGRTPPGRLELTPLADLLADLRAPADQPPVQPSVALAAILADGLSPTALTTDNGDLPATAGSNAHGPAQRAAGLPKWRTTMIGKLKPGLTSRGAVSWTARSWTARLRTTLARRIATSLGAVVLVTGVAPAMANAAGANVPNPLAVALSSSSRSLANLFTADEGTAAPAAAACPTPTPTSAPTVQPTVQPTAQPTAEPTGSAEPTGEPTAAGDGDDCDDDPTPTPTPTPTPSATGTPSPSGTPTPTPPTEDEPDGEHGRIVSTVAKCAPRGKDPLLASAGEGLRNHGSFVKVAAHGGTLTTSWGRFDLSTLSGAQAFCAAVEQARAALPASTDDKDSAKNDKGNGHAKAKSKSKGHGGRGKPAKGK